MNNLGPNQICEHHPDLVCRVYHEKFLDFIDNVVNRYGFELSESHSDQNTILLDKNSIYIVPDIS